MKGAMDITSFWIFIAGFLYTALLFGGVFWLLRDQTKEIKAELKRLFEKDKDKK